MRKTGNIAATVLVLLVLAGWLVFRVQLRSFLSGENDFRITDTASVSRIEIISRDSIILTRTARGWTLNGATPAGQVAVDNLLFSFSLMRSKGTGAPPELSGAQAVKLRFTAGKKVLRMRYYSIGGVSFLQREGSKKLSAVGVYGFPDIDPATVIGTEKDFWRDRTLFDLTSTEIREVSVLHPGKPGSDFTIRNEAGIPKLFRFEEGKEIPVTEANDEKMNFYLSYFGNVFSDPADTGALSHPAEARWIISVTDTSGVSHRLEVYPLISGSGTDMFKCLVRYDSEEELRLTRCIVLDLLLQDIEHFLIY